MIPQELDKQQLNNGKFFIYFILNLYDFRNFISLSQKPSINRLHKFNLSLSLSLIIIIVILILNDIYKYVSNFS